MDNSGPFFQLFAQLLLCYVESFIPQGVL
ncbi:hypothetical protein AT1219_30255 [Vibrio alginolyticus]